jgi:multidrug efflux pump subunit AcrA (membrane-fusion protein)
MKARRILAIVAPTVVVVATFAVAILTYDTWRGWLPIGPRNHAEQAAEHSHEHDGADRITVTQLSQRNMGLVIEPIKLAKYYQRRLELPGIIVERPGRSERAVAAPLAGVVTQIKKAPLETVTPGEVLFILQPNSEYLQNSQAQLYKTVRELAINQKEQDRLSKNGGEDLFRGRLIELRYEESRLLAGRDVYRQDLLARGLREDQLWGIEEGQFVKAVEVKVPGTGTAPVYEVETLKITVGEQVQSGQLLSELADHQALYVKGLGFERDAALLARIRAEGSPVQMEAVDQVDLDGPAGKGVQAAALTRGPLGVTDRWESPPILQIAAVSNTIEPESRTLPFYLELKNEYRERQGPDGKTYFIWRYRTGQRVRLVLTSTVTRPEGVFELPAGAVVWEGPEAFVFRARGDSNFERKPVQVLQQDARTVVLAYDGSPEGLREAHRLVVSGAQALNRVIKLKAGGSAGHGHDHGPGGHSH